MSQSAWALAFRLLEGEGLRQIRDPRVRLRAGLWGLLLGPAVFVIGFLAGQYALAFLLALLLGPHVSGEVRVPRIATGLLFFGAIWGGMMFLVGVSRVIEALVPRHSGWLSIVVLPALGTGVLIALVAAGYAMFEP